MKRLAAIIFFAVTSLAVAESVGAETFARLVLATTGETVSDKLVIEGQSLFVPLDVLRSLGIEYNINGRTLTIKDSNVRLDLTDKMVRLDQLTKALDCDLSFDAATSTAAIFARLKSVEVNGFTLRALFTLPVAAPSIRAWSAPWRVAIDVVGAKLAATSNKIPVDGSGLLRVRLGQFAADTCRIAVDTKGKFSGRLIPSASAREIRIELEPGEAKPAHKSRAGLDGLVIAIDPGHGGKDPGALAEGVCEKDVVLAVARALKSALEKSGAVVFLTREDDRFVELEERPAAARARSADLFISIHCNASSPDQASGIETYYSTGTGSRDLASAVQTSMIRSTGEYDRRVHPSPDYTVLESASIPSILIECGFIDSKADRDLLCKSDYQTKLANAIVEGVKSYAIGTLK